MGCWAATSRAYGTHAAIWQAGCRTIAYARSCASAARLWEMHWCRGTRVSSGSVWHGWRRSSAPACRQLVVRTAACEVSPCGSAFVLGRELCGTVAALVFSTNTTSVWRVNRTHWAGAKLGPRPGSANNGMTAQEKEIHICWRCSVIELRYRCMPCVVGCRYFVARSTLLWFPPTWVWGTDVHKGLALGTGKGNKIFTFIVYFI